MTTDGAGLEPRQHASILSTNVILSNFALATAFVTAVIAGCSSAYMLGYFAAFDSKAAYHVNRLVQYSDVLQFAFTISGNVLALFASFGLLTLELSKRLRHPLARIDAQTVATIIVTPLAIWAYLVANNYQPGTAILFFAVAILVGTTAANLAWSEHALKLHRVIPTLLMAFLALTILGFFFGNAAKEQGVFQVTIGDAKPRAMRLIAVLSRGYLLFDPSNQHIMLVPEKEIKQIEREPQD
jgi:hypothetical protein